MGGFLRRVFLCFMIAIIVGLVGAIPLADATGFERGYSPFASQSPLVWTCGAILFLFTLAVMAPVTRLVALLFATVGGAEDRPKPLVAMGMMGCGTLLICHLSLWPGLRVSARRRWMPSRR